MSIDGKAWIQGGSERQVEAIEVCQGRFLGPPVSWLDSKSSGFGFFQRDPLLALCVSFQLHAESFPCDIVGYWALLGES